MSEWVVAEAPSNIALIKYMGKTGIAVNAPANSSLSYTLDHMRTRVRIRWESGHASKYVWRPLFEAGMHAPELSEKGRARFLAHAERCLGRLRGSRTDVDTMLASHSVVVESANGFPSDCGLASSASSFAALTLACAELVGFASTTAGSRKLLADLSREGSGSSCRSMFSPWALWTASGAEKIEGFPHAANIRHLAIIVDENRKTVSSSEAHLRVPSSLLFRGRVERAEDRLRALIDCFEFCTKASVEADSIRAWNRAAHLVWAESWDMHALFETSEPPFGYFVPSSVYALNCIRELSNEMRLNLGEGKFREPIVTMDAGPNVHVLLWKDSEPDPVLEAFVSELKKRLGDTIRVIG